jgi:two-component system, chemotaxis family, protein-glutamate methylesterase/glutaminase
MREPSREPVTPRLIGIASSAGGFQPLEEILGNLPHGFPVPILVLPGINPDYVNWLAARLDAKSRLQVIAAEDGQVPSPGCVYVAAEHPGVLIMQGRLRFLSRKSDWCYRRVKDALFCSMAWDVGARALAVILDGLGNDGAEGMREVRDNGGYTIVQDRATSMIYGTAKFAVKIDAACESLPAQEIAPRLVALATPGPPDRT